MPSKDLLHFGYFNITAWQIIGGALNHLMNNFETILFPAGTFYTKTGPYLYKKQRSSCLSVSTFL
jgi:hypothetical protein